MPLKLGIIGCGQIARAIMAGQRPDGFIDSNRILINDTNPERVDLFTREFNAKYRPYSEVITASDIVLLAVRPQQVKEVLLGLATFWNKDKLLISTAAGITIAALEKIAGQIPVVRTMPNTPCLAGKGVVAISSGNFAAERHIKITKQIFINIAKCIIIEENYLNAVTAISGSGPAYLYFVMEALLEAAAGMGLDAQLSKFLIMETWKGSLELWAQTGEHPAALREKVSTPGGATEAAISQLEGQGVKTAFAAAVKKAFQRAGDLDG